MCLNKEALAKCKQDGKKLGRPKGPAKTLKLHQKHDEIMGYLQKKISKRSIAKLIECSPSSLYAWLKKDGLTSSNIPTIPLAHILE